MKPCLAALGLVAIALLLGAMQDDHVPRDYSTVIVETYFAPFHCGPCNLQKPELARMHRTYQQVWLAVSSDGKTPRKVRQFMQQDNPYSGRGIRPRAYPTTVIYSADERGIYSERFRLTGWRDGDYEILCHAVRRAAER